MFTGQGRSAEMPLVRAKQEPRCNAANKSVVTVFESGGTRITQLYRVVEMNFLQAEEDDYEDSEEWFESCEDYYDFEGLTHTEFQRPPTSFYHSPPRCIDLKESDAERKARSLQEEKQNKDKAEKKRIKKKRQKERKRLDKAEKEKLKEEGDLSQEAEDAAKKQQSSSKGEKDLSLNDTGRCADNKTQVKDTNGTNYESSDEESDKDDDAEELDFTSSFVSKAAEIVKRKLDQKPKLDPRERKTQIKSKILQDKPKDNNKEDSQADNRSSLEDNIKRSNELALIGNGYANIGDYSMAVKFFTDAVKYNPTEFKLFGNRSFCFEKLQEYEKALADAELCLSFSPRWVKGLFRKGRALAGLKRYVEACQAFREVLELDRKCTEAAQELMRVQIIQLMEYGYTREQSSNALIIHGTFDKSLEALSRMNQQSNVRKGLLPRPQVVNTTGTSPVLSAYGPSPPHGQKASPEIPNSTNQPIFPAVKTISNASQPPAAAKELFPVWVGNVVPPLNEVILTSVFQSAGRIHSVKMLSIKRCAFVNFTKLEDCNKAIRTFHGSIVKGVRLVVRYPERFPDGLGISRTAIKAHYIAE